MAECRSCNAIIVWVQTKNAAMPLDAHLAHSGSTPRSALVAVPTLFDDGNIVLDNGVVRVVSPGPGQFRSHFASCPEADSHRKR